SPLGRPGRCRRSRILLFSVAMTEHTLSGTVAAMGQGEAGPGALSLAVITFIPCLSIHGLRRRQCPGRHSVARSPLELSGLLPGCAEQIPRLSDQLLSVRRRTPDRP